MQTARKHNKSFSAIRHYCRLLPFLYLIFGLFFFLPIEAENFVGTASATPKIMKLSIEGNRLIAEAEILELI